MRVIEKLVYRANRAYKKKKYKVAYFYYAIIRIIFAADIPPSIVLGESVQFVHNGLGVVIHKNTVIDDDVIIYQNVTIGGNEKVLEDGDTIRKGAPVIEDGAIVYAGACILGPIRIGKNCIVGANAVVLQDVPDDCIAIGIPAQIKEKKNEK